MKRVKLTLFIFYDVQFGQILYELAPSFAMFTGDSLRRPTKKEFFCRLELKITGINLSHGQARARRIRAAVVIRTFNSPASIFCSVRILRSAFPANFFWVILRAVRSRRRCVTERIQFGLRRNSQFIT
jgi:hypothetical protein